MPIFDVIGGIGPAHEQRVGDPQSSAGGDRYPAGPGARHGRRPNRDRSSRGPRGLMPEPVDADA